MTTHISSDKRIYNFSAGPSTLPLSVMEKAKQEFLSFEGCGMSAMEVSHRSPEFTRIIEKAETGIRRELSVPDSHAICFIQGGATMQFAMVPMNLYEKGKPVDMIHTGLWTKKAMTELKKFAELNMAGSGEPDKFTKLPSLESLNFNPNASYVHLCSNNTVTGTQWKAFPDTKSVPLVADMSSDILSRKIDISKFGIVFAGAQKNLGPAGLALVILRKDLTEKSRADLPIYMQYRTHVDNNSLYNTPPTYTIYMISLVMDWFLEQGGLSKIEEKNNQKAKLLYDAIEASSFYHCPVAAQDRSAMNVVFRIKDNDENLEKQFAKEAEAAGLSGLKGHRLAGGLRASIYNAQSVEAIEALIAFMRSFEKKS